MAAKSAKPKTDNATEVKALTKRLAELEQDIKTAVARVAKVSDEMLDEVYVMVSDLKRQRSKVEADLANLNSQTDAKTSQEWTPEQVLELVHRLADELETLEPRMLQEKLRSVIERITLTFKTVEQGKRRIQRLAGGEIHLPEKVMAGTGFEPATSRL